MLFNYVIGNPPYQDVATGEQNSFAPPVYNKFMDAAYQIADKVELICPARFLSNAGATPKEWNEKMLNDKHFKVLWHEQDSSKVFSNTDIKGGLVVTYRDDSCDYGAIEVYTAYDELNDILHKIIKRVDFGSFSQIVGNRGLYRFSDEIYEEYPKEMKQFTNSNICANSFDRLTNLFTDSKPDNEYEYIRIFGLENRKRCYKWFRKDLMKEVKNLYRYKVMIPAANGSGAIGEVLSTPLVGEPLVGFTETFISIGETDSLTEANAVLKYVKTKFARAMLGVLKVTQHNAKPTWRYVPMQNFTEDSDIDWSRPIHNIDLQLYNKYDLNEKEIEFIETHIKEME